MKDLEDDEREFPIRVYTKVELALLYAPHLSENAALNNLSRLDAAQQTPDGCARGGGIL